MNWPTGVWNVWPQSEPSFEMPVPIHPSLGNPLPHPSFLNILQLWSQGLSVARSSQDPQLTQVYVQHLRKWLTGRTRRRTRWGRTAGCGEKIKRPSDHSLRSQTFRREKSSRQKGLLFKVTKSFMWSEATYCHVQWWLPQKPCNQSLMVQFLPYFLPFTVVCLITGPYDYSAHLPGQNFISF